MENHNSRLVFLENQPYLVRLLDGGDEEEIPNEWDDIIKISEAHHNPFRWRGIYSVCNNIIKSSKEPPMCVLRGHISCNMHCLDMTDFRSYALGFRPVLVPVCEDTLEINTAFIKTLPDGSTMKKFSLTMDEKPVPILENTAKTHAYIQGSQLDFSDTKHNITWIKFPGGFVANRNLLREVSWNDLHQQGFC